VACPHLLFPTGAEAAWLLVSACAAARDCANQAVTTAALDALVGLALCLDGLRSPPVPESIRLRICSASWHALSVDEALERINLGDARLNCACFTESSAPPLEERPASLSALVLDELDNPLTPILGTGAALSGVVGAPLDAGLILGVLGLNVVVGAAQRRRVDAALGQLIDRHAAPVWVKGGTGLERREASSLHVGDVILLASGEVVPADCRLVTAEGLLVDESALTDESLNPAAKSPRFPARPAPWWQRWVGRPSSAGPDGPDGHHHPYGGRRGPRPASGGHRPWSGCAAGPPRCGGARGGGRSRGASPARRACAGSRCR